MSFLLDLALPFSRLFEAEDAHGLAIRALSMMPKPAVRADDPRLSVSAFGLNFRNPVGLAAGFDKNAQVPDAILALGFGFAEVGTLTPKPQPGNPRPRVFRLLRDEGVINRLGFNNEGFHAAVARLSRRRAQGILGINVGANKDSADRIADYAAGVETFSPYASYLTINISSPNTPGLRDLQAAGMLDELMKRVLDARERAAQQGQGRKPILLKIAPDVALGDLDDIVEIAKKRAIDGMIVSNTTITRPASLRDSNAKEQGGLSGKPLFDLSTKMLAETYLRAERAFPIVGVGGIDSADAAWRKIRAGATLVQLYTALVYRGFGIAGEIKRGLSLMLDRGKHRSIQDVVGRDAVQVAASGAQT
ncbi:MAG: quinone-dependent dihydroorotate dehydrogenase [Xanthobacteraceae bacterium]|nr:quinone-dependent dihydroorotate dehydrogenase [Xanthobacteraceae bacterium]